MVCYVKNSRVEGWVVSIGQRSSLSMRSGWVQVSTTVHVNWTWSVAVWERQPNQWFAYPVMLSSQTKLLMGSEPFCDMGFQNMLAAMAWGEAWSKQRGCYLPEEITR